MTNPGRRKPPSTRTVTGGVHEGRLVLMSADRYRGVYPSSLEAVQNALDAGATRIVVAVDLRDRQAYIVDNGTGADGEQLDTAIKSIGYSDKPEGALGRWGIGFISPTMACTTYTFMTWARTDDGVRRLTLRETEIREMWKLKFKQEVIGTRPALPSWAAEHATDKFAVEWRTLVHMDELKPDRTTSAFDPQEFRRTVRARFSRVMRTRGALVRLIFVGRGGRRKVEVHDIDPSVYHGESLGDVTYTTKDTGEVTIRLLLAPEDKGRHDGEVDILRTDDNTTVSIIEFARQALVPGKHVTPRLREVMSALKSGRFAGEIMCEKLDLHVERKGFVSNDALFGLLKILVEWYENHGYIYYEVGREESREQRWRDAGVESQHWLSVLLGQARYSELWESVFPVLSGADGSGGTGVKPRRAEKPDAPKEKREKTDKPADKSESSEAPEGDGKQSRRQVGLSLAHASSRSRRFWNFDFTTGELTINVGHEVWGQLDETNGRHEPRNARWTQEMREWLALQVLVLLSRHPNPDDFERNRGMIDDMVPLFADQIVQRDTVRRRKVDAAANEPEEG